MLRGAVLGGPVTFATDTQYFTEVPVPPGPATVAFTAPPLNVAVPAPLLMLRATGVPTCPVAQSPFEFWKSETVLEPAAVALLTVAMTLKISPSVTLVAEGSAEMVALALTVTVTETPAAAAPAAFLDTSVYCVLTEGDTLMLPVVFVMVSLKFGSRSLVMTQLTPLVPRVGLSVVDVPAVMVLAAAPSAAPLTAPYTVIPIVAALLAPPAESVNTSVPGNDGGVTVTARAEPLVMLVVVEGPLKTALDAVMVPVDPPVPPGRKSATNVTVPAVDAVIALVSAVNVRKFGVAVNVAISGVAVTPARLVTSSVKVVLVATLLNVLLVVPVTSTPFSVAVWPALMVKSS